MMRSGAGWPQVRLIYLAASAWSLIAQWLLGEIGGWTAGWLTVRDGRWCSEARRAECIGEES